MTESEFLAALREREGLRRAVLQKIVIDTKLRGCTFEIVTDRAYSSEDERAASAVVRSAVPRSLGTAVRIHKLVADAQLVRRKIVEYLARNHRAAAACVREEDIDVQIEGDLVRFAFGVDAAERGFFEKNAQLLPGVERMLSHNFCSRFRGSLADKDKGGIVEEEEPEEEEPFDYRPARAFPVVDFQPIDEPNVPKMATYLSDCDFQSNSLTVCGQIVHVEERMTRAKTDASGAVKEGRPYLRFTIADATGRMTFSYFPRKKTADKIRALQAGDSIVCTGANELYNGRLSYTARYINRGAPPADFVPESARGRRCPCITAACIRKRSRITTSWISSGSPTCRRGWSKTRSSYSTWKRPASSTRPRPAARWTRSRRSAPSRSSAARSAKNSPPSSTRSAPSARRSSR